MNLFKSCAYIAAILFSLNTTAQKIQWLKQTASYPRIIGVNKTANLVYGVDQQNIFVYDNTGGQKKNIPFKNCSITSAVADAANNTYITGGFTGTASINGATIISAGEFDIFVAKLNSLNGIEWIKTSSGANTEIAHAISMDASGNIILLGHYTGTLKFGSFSAGTKSDYNLFAISMSSFDGSIKEMRYAGGINGSNASLSHLSMDGNGDVFADGTFYNDIIIDGVTVKPVGSNDVVVIKFTPAGNVSWYKQIGSSMIESAGGLKIDNENALYVAGSFSNSITLDGKTIISAGATDIFLCKWDNDGNLKWLESGGGTYIDDVYSIALGLDGDIYLAGSYTGNAHFGKLSLPEIGEGDAMVIKYSKDGEAKWQLHGGGIGEDDFSGIEVDNTGGVFITGSNQESAQFDGQYTSANSDFISWISPGVTGIEELTDDETVQVYPNPSYGTIIISAKKFINGRFSILDVIGKDIRSTEAITAPELKVDLNNLLPGIYFLKIENSSGYVIKKFVVATAD